LLHVIDAAHPDRDGQIAAVSAVLEEIGAQGVPQIRVYNKIDATGIPPGGERGPSGIIDSVRASALTGAGCVELRAALAERFPSREPVIAPAADSIVNV
jgi:GTP-binding protein HflX